MASLLAKTVVTAFFTIGLQVVALANTAVSGLASIPAFSINYSVGNNHVTGGKAKLKLGRQNEHYQLVLETKPTGVFRLSKKGKIREVAELKTLNPPYLSSEYSYTNFGDKKRSYQLAYDREKSIATIARNGKTERFNIDPAAGDRLSTMLAVMHRLRDNPNLSQFSIEVIDHRGTQTVDFISLGQETIKTKLGNVVATRVQRKRSNSTRHTVTWFAALGPDGLPIPVQIEQFKRGKMKLRMKIQEFSIFE